MRTTLIAAIVFPIAIGLFPALAVSDSAVIIRPEDIVSATAKAGTVEVVVTGPKSKQLFEKGKHVAIEFSVPFVHTKDVFVCEVHRGARVTTVSFKFSDAAAANDFAEQLYVARSKVLSQCDCH